MKILALEFSSPQRSVALVQTDATAEKCIENQAIETGSSKNEPFAMIEDVLRQAGLEREQVDRLVIGLGPGSYTGIRSAIALAQGWELARQVPLQGVSSAECVAAQLQAQGIFGRIAVVIDAQRGEFYFALFELSPAGLQEISPLRLVSRETVVQQQKQCDLMVGPEVDKWFSNGQLVFPRAATLASLASRRNEFLPGEKLEPIYLRATTFVKAPPPRILPD